MKNVIADIERRLGNLIRSQMFLLLSFWCALLIAGFFVKPFSFNRWDNFEYFTPTILEAHSRWLHGQIPLWSSHQHLGESLLASSQAGIFYFPYTLCVAIVNAFLPTSSLLFLVAVFHLSFGYFGWMRLFNFLGVRRSISYACTILILGGGYVSLLIPVWTFVGGFLCWIPWTLYGSLLALENSPSAVWLPIGLAMTAFIGYPQLWVYLVAWIFLFTLLYALIQRTPAVKIGQLIILLVSGALLGSPSLMPTYTASLTTIRAEGLSLSNFLERSVHPSHLLSLFLPTIKTVHSYLVHDGCVSYFLATWVPVVIVGGLLLLVLQWLQGRHQKGIVDIRPQEQKLRRLLICSFLTSILFTIFSLGRFGFLYPLTHAVPLWSSFRWPFKFLLFAASGIGITAALASELWCSKPPSPLFKRLASIWAIIAITVVFFMAPWDHRSVPTILGNLYVIVGILSIAALPFLDNRMGRAILIIVSLMTVTLNTVFTQRNNLKYYDESVGRFRSDAFEIDKSYRVIPVSNYGGSPRMQSLGLFQAASLNDYDSATGCTTHMIPVWYRALLPSNEYGLLPDHLYGTLLGSNFLKALNVRYALVKNDDTIQLQRLRISGFRLIKKLEESSVFEQANVLPRVYFSNKVENFNRERLRNIFLDNQSGIRTALLFDIEKPKALPRAEVISIEKQSAGISAHVFAPNGGLIVFSSLYYPEWKVFIDGVKREPLFVNNLVLGAWVPPGATNVQFLYVSDSLNLSLLPFFVGLFLIGVWFFKTKRPKSAFSMKNVVI